jgi:hypothetical protein
MIPVMMRFWMPHGAGGYPCNLTPIMWFDAADNDTISVVGGGVDSWRCKITDTVWSAPSADNRPVISTDSFFNEQFIDFDNDGNNKYLTGDAINIAVPFTAFFVVYWVDISGYKGFGTFSSTSTSSISSANGAPSLFVYSTISGSQNRSPQVNGSTSTYSAYLSTTISAAGIYTYIVPNTTPGDTVLEFLNSSLSETASGGTYNSTFSFTTIGCTDSLYISKGQVGEVIVYDGVLTSEQKDCVYNYLADKWLP